MADYLRDIMRVSTEANQKLDESAENHRVIEIRWKALWACGPYLHIVLGSQGEFNENTHAFYTKRAMASAKRMRIKMAP